MQASSPMESAMEEGVANPSAITTGSSTLSTKQQPQPQPQPQPNKMLYSQSTSRLSLTSELLGQNRVPIVEVGVHNLTYQPKTSTATAKEQRQQQQSSVKSAIASAAASSSSSSMEQQQQQQQQQRTKVLQNITTTIAPYKLTAWMGPSGSGKTSLTSVVAGLAASSDPMDLSPESTLTVNGDVGTLPKRLIGVVWQDDLLLSNLTVEETIFFAARLKLSASISTENVQRLVETTMEELGLIHIRDHLIGSPFVSHQSGISGGERKRTAVAAELVVRPSLLLLDEPTSGLDATTAYSLMTTLKDLAGLGHAIAVVIHQPRTDIFQLLDHLLLLSKGRVVYNGRANRARTYLESTSVVPALPPETGIADWIMDSISYDEKRTNGSGGPLLPKCWERHIKETNGKVDDDDEDHENTDEDHTTRNQHQPSPSSVALTEPMSTLSMTNTSTATSTSSKPVVKRPYQSKRQSLAELKNAPIKYEASFGTQMQLVMWRTLKQRRGEKFTKVACLLTLSFVVFTALFWWQLPNDTSWTFERNSLLFFMMIAQGNQIVVGSMTVFQRERALLRRERAKKLYGVLPYFLAKTASDMTNSVLLPVLYGMISYWTAGLRPSLGHFLRFVLAFYMTLSCAQSMGFLLSILIPSLQIALILAPPITLFFMIIGGFYIPLANMHVGIRWASYTSFARYGYSAMMVNEFEGRLIPCAEDVSISIGTNECPLPGNAVYEGVGVDGVFANYWFNVVVVSVMHVTFLLTAYALLRRSK